jgi:hypothetical protein
MISRKKKKNTITRWNAIDLGCLITMDHGFVRHPMAVERQRIRDCDCLAKIILTNILA